MADTTESATTPILQPPTSMSTRDARIQKWAVIAFAVVEAIIIAAVLWTRARG